MRKSSQGSGAVNSKSRNYAFRSNLKVLFGLHPYLDGRLKLEQDGLGDEDLAGLGAEIADLGLEKLDLLAGTAAPHLQKAIDYRIEIDLVLVRHCITFSIFPIGTVVSEEKKSRFGSDRQVPKPTDKRKRRKRRVRSRTDQTTAFFAAK